MMEKKAARKMRKIDDTFDATPGIEVATAIGKDAAEKYGKILRNAIFFSWNEHALTALAHELNMLPHDDYVTVPFSNILPQPINSAQLKSAIINYLRVVAQGTVPPIDDCVVPCTLAQSIRLNTQAAVLSYNHGIFLATQNIPLAARHIASLYIRRPRSHAFDRVGDSGNQESLWG